jgi:hypothetical protein
LLPLVLLFTAEIPLHNWNLWRFEKALTAVRHPRQTKPVRLVSDVGNFEATGNQCEYFAAELRSYTGTRQSIEKFYRDLTIKNVITGERQPVQLAFVSDGILSPADTLPPGYRELKQWRLPQEATKANCYVVCVLYCDPNSGFDYRCQ